MAQATLSLALLLTLALRPPAEGAMLVVPLGPAGEGRLADVALDHGGKLLGAGPVGGSLVIYGRRAALQPAFRAAHAIVLAAPAMLCGDAAARPGKGAAA